MASIHPLRRRRYTLEQRQEFVAQYRQSEGSLSEFARRHDLNVSTLYQWLQRAKKEPGAADPVFREVMLGASPLGADWRAEITVGAGLMLRLGGQSSPEFIARILQHLRRP